MTKYAGRGLVIAINGTNIGQCTSFDEVGSTRDQIDASAFGDDWKDYVVGQQDGSAVNMVLALDPADSGQDDLKDAYDTGDQVTFTLTHDDSGWAVTFPAILTTLTQGATLGGLLQMSATVKILNPGVTDAS